MTWKNLFDKRTLDDGANIFYDGAVSSVYRQRDSRWSALIHCGETFSVKVELDGQGNVCGMTCTCPEKERRGKPCRHMAAACFAVEDTFLPHDEDGRVIRDPDHWTEGPGNTYTEDNTRVETPFGRLAGSNEYHYFDLNYMTRDMPLMSKVCEKGRSLADNGDLTLKQVTINYPDRYNGTVLAGMAQGEIREKGERIVVNATFNRNLVLNLSCGCSANFTSKETERGPSSIGRVCRHGAALLYKLEDYILRENPGDATDAGAMRLLDDLERGSGGAGDTDSAGAGVRLRLEPRLEGNGTTLAATFRAGTDRMRNLKELSEFVDHFENGDKINLGKSTVIDCSVCALDSFSLRCYRFIKRAVEEERTRGSYTLSGVVDRGSGLSATVRGGIPLIGWRLDAFYDLVDGRQFDYIGRNDWGQPVPGQRVNCRDARPEAKITVEKLADERGKFEGVRVSGQVPVLAEGLSAYYRLAEDGCLERISKESVQDLQPLRRLADRQGQISFSVGRGHLGWFRKTLLPVLEKCGPVELTETDAEFIAEYTPPEPEFRFYLDTDGRNLFCRVLAVYGEKEVDISGLLSGDSAGARAPWRDAGRERAVMLRAARYFPVYDDAARILHCGQDEDAVFQVLSSGVSALMELGEVSCSQDFLRLKVRPVPKFTVSVSLESGLLDLDISSEDLSPEDLQGILDGYRKKKKCVRLKNGDFLRTDSGEVDRMEALTNMLDTLRITPEDLTGGKILLPAYRALYLDKMLEENSEILAERDSRFRDLVMGFEAFPDAAFRVPESLAPVMRGYQTEGFKFLRTLEAYHFGGILADDMGLGKTLQMIAVFLAWKEEGKQGPSLVVCPASLVYNWEEEISRFAPRLKVGVIAGTQKEREKMLKKYDRYDVLVTSYDLLKRDIDKYEDLSFSGQVLDEAQFIKNHTTEAAKSVKLINSRYRFALTGTPIENRLSELWSIFDFLMPGFLYSYENFREETEIPVMKKGDKDAAERLRRMVSPFILRRLKKDVLKDLPDKLEEVVYARADTEQQNLCDGQVARIQGMLASQDEAAFSREKIQILAELTRLREICCDPSLLYEDYDGGSAKREACLELIDQAMEGGHRMLIFSQFTSMLALLEEDLDRAGISYYKIIGATPKQERVDLVRKFNEGDTPVFLISLKAGGTGLNLTGADVVIHYDPWWNMAVENQATDRAHRIGQTRVVTEYKLILKDSVEERILRMQEAKSGLAEEILSGDGSAGGLGSLSREDLLELLGV